MNEKELQELREKIRILIANTPLNCCSTDSANAPCRPIFENEETLTDSILSLIQPYLEAKVKETAKEFIPLVDKLFDALAHADFSNGIEAEGLDEGRVMAHRYITELKQQYEELKAKYLKEG